MRIFKLVPALVLVVLVAGCASTGHRGSDESASERRAPRGTRLGKAEALYREALDHYVQDRWDEASEALADAVVLLDAADAAGDDEVLRGELRGKVTYFLGVIGRSSPTWQALEGAEPARTDTIPVAVSHASAPPEACLPPISVVQNERVEKWLHYFQGRGRGEMSKWLSRAGKYRPMIDTKLGENGLPRELFYLAMIESGLNPKAYSSAHASGMWQFMASRGRQYGLRVDYWIDERRDPEKATEAACAYLKDLYEMLGSWELALAGYNAGEGRVVRARRNRPSCPDYWCLDLPRETEDFVPKFMAAVLIGSDPEAFGFEKPSPQAPLAYDTIEVSEAIDLGAVAKACGTTTDEIKQLNPALRRSCTAPRDGSFQSSTLRLPAGSGASTLAAVASLPPDKRAGLERHEIRKGETLSSIAAHYDSSVDAIMSANGIRNASRIQAGQEIVIPVGQTASDDQDRARAPKTVTYTVKKGDTISSIARRHGKDAKDLLKWNGLTWKSRIYPGDRIKILGA